MVKKLTNYGFDTWQVEKLIKAKKLITGHGTYTLKGDKLFLKSTSGTKEIDLDNLEA